MSPISPSLEKPLRLRTLRLPKVKLILDCKAQQALCSEAFIPGLDIHPFVTFAVLSSLDRYFLSPVVFVYCSFVGFQISMMVEGL